MVDIRRLRFNDWNIDHIALHGVTPEEVEEACRIAPMFSETYRERLRLIGPTANGRMLTVILGPEEAGVFYPITARPASRKERRRYQERGSGEEMT
jgi:uncharacterized protein